MLLAEHGNKARVLAILLACVTFAIVCVGQFNALFSALWVALFQSLFVFAYFTCYRTLSLSVPGFWLRWALLAWIAVYLLSYFFLLYRQGAVINTQTILASFRVALLLVHLLFFFTVAAYLQRYHAALTAVYRAIVMALLGVLVVYLYSYWGAGITDSDSWFFAPPMAFHIRNIAVLFTAGVLICSMRFYWRSSGLSLFAILDLFCVLVFVAFLVWSGGRAVLVSMLCCMLLGLWLCSRFHGFSLKPLGALVIVCVLGIFLAEAMAVFSWNGLGYLHAAVTVVSEPDALVPRLNGLSSGRLAIWSISLQALASSPWVGLGPNTFIFVDGYSSTYGLHPHNFVIQLLLESGVIGSVLLVGMLITIWLRVIGYLRSFGSEVNGQYLIAALMVLCLTMNACLDGSYYHPQAVFLLLIGYAVLSCRSHKLAEGAIC